MAKVAAGAPLVRRSLQSQQCTGHRCAGAHAGGNRSGYLKLSVVRAGLSAARHTLGNCPADSGLLSFFTELAG